MQKFALAVVVCSTFTAVALGLTPAATPPTKGPAAPKVPSKETVKQFEKDVKEAVDKVAGQDGSPDPAMAAWVKFMTPGPEHAELARMAGMWDVDTTAWMAPGAPPTRSTMTARFEMLLGGRFLKETITGDFDGMPFEGVGIVGFDNGTRQHVMTWYDTMGTGIMQGTGTMSADGKVCTWKATGTNPMTGQPAPMRMEKTMVDANTFMFNMFAPGPDGKEFKNMAMTYTRRGTSGATAPTAPTRPTAPTAPTAPSTPAAPKR